MTESKDLSASESNFQIPDKIGILPLKETCVLPLAVIPISVGQESSLKLVNEALASNKLIGLMAEKAEKGQKGENLHQIGTLAIIHRVIKSIDGSLSLIVQGLERIQIRRIIEREPFIKAAVKRLPEVSDDDAEIEALKRLLRDLFQHLVDLVPEIPVELANAITKLDDARQICYLIAAATPMSYQARQRILETTSMKYKLREVIKILQEEIAVRDLQRDIASQTEQKLSKSQKEIILREQIRTLQEELGEIVDEDSKTDIEKFKLKKSKLNLSKSIDLELSKELKRLEKIPDISPEHAMLFEYVDFFVNLPWHQSTKSTINIFDAKKTLDQDHYDLKKVKERIIEYLAVLKLKVDRQAEADKGEKASDAIYDHLGIHSPILCFVGPPGVGKTSLGESIARATKRKFIHISLGGIHDESEIRGHRRTYIGALPGRILKAISRIQSDNPVFMLDEIDKLHYSMQGDPAAALLEVLDPAQNHAFIDNYLGVPFDLSKVMFICTANTTSSISPALLDRMEVIELSGYIQEEKIEIAKKYLIPQQGQKHGLYPKELLLDNQAISSIISGYTREAGVRSLDREIATITRKIASRISEGGKAPSQITTSMIREFLGEPRFHDDIYERIDRPGIAVGLAWTPTGGDILFVEAAIMPGKDDKLILTGMMGEVMRESAAAAVTYIRSHLKEMGLPEQCLLNKIIHIHVPEGAIPKDGPSAGVTILAALTSVITNKIVARDIAMTGEITLRGKILPVGGIRDKVLSAYRHGITKILLPSLNFNDLHDIPEKIRDEISITFVNSAEDIIYEAFDGTVLQQAI